MCFEISRILQNNISLPAPKYTANRQTDIKCIWCRLLMLIDIYQYTNNRLTIYQFQVILHIPQSILNTLFRMKDFQVLSESVSSFVIPIEYKTNCILVAFTMRTFKIVHDNQYNSYAVDAEISIGGINKPVDTSTAMANFAICT